MSCVAFHPLTWPFFVFLCFLCFASHRWPLSNDTQDVIMHVIPIAGCDPTPLCSVRFVLVVVVCFFVCLCASFLVWFVFDGIAHWTLYWSITSAFEAIDELTALHANLQFIFFAAVERV